MNAVTGRGYFCAFLATMLCGLCSAAVAEEMRADAPFKRHTLELRGNLGGVETENDQRLDELDDLDTAHAAFGYWFNLNRNFSLGVSYLDGESDDFDFPFFGVLSATKLEYNAAIVGAEGRLPLGRENFLFARLGLAFYDFDLVDDGDDLESDSGSDVQFAAGWSKRWGSGLGMEVMYEFLALGAKREVSTVGVGLTYSF